MSAAYVPARLGDLVNWSANFSTVLTASPGTYFQSAGTAGAVAAAQAAFANAYAASGDRANRTATLVQATVNARGALLALVRPIATFISSSPAVSDADKQAIGVTVRRTTQTPIPPPVTSPIISLTGAQPGQLTLRLADTNTPTARAKPAGAISAQLFADIATSQASLPSLSITTPLSGIFTRAIIAVDTTGNAGKWMRFTARWQTRGAPQGGNATQTGPFGQPLDTLVL